MTENSKLPGLPQQFPHMFFDVAFDLVPEITYKDLVRLSQLAKRLGHVNLYGPLVDCLRKMQWAKLAGLEAIIVEKRIAALASPESIPFDPVGQAQHSKALFDFVAHGKSSLDSLAVFLNGFLGLKQSGGNRDFRKADFRQRVCSADGVIGEQIAKLEEWLDKDRASSDGIVATRDEWLHRGSPAVQAMFPPTEIGYLPIPKTLKGGFPSMNTPLTKEHYWTTQEFVQFHFDRLTRLFVAVVERCIAVESEGVSEQIEQGTTDTPISAFAMRGTKETTLKQIKFKHWTPVFLNANELMEELPQRLLRILSEKEQDLFAKLARYKTFGMHDRERNFIVMSDDFLEHSLQVQPKEIEALKEVGLIADSKLVLPNGAVFVYGQRGFNIYWSDEESRSIPAVVFTRLGRELAALVKTEYDDNYVRQVISMMHASKVNVQLMAISDFQETSFRYDNLGTFEY